MYSEIAAAVGLTKEQCAKKWESIMGALRVRLFVCCLLTLIGCDLCVLVVALSTKEESNRYKSNGAGRATKRARRSGNGGVAFTRSAAI